MEIAPNANFNPSDFLVRSAEQADRSQIAHIIHFGSYVHRHLDWRPPLDWIGHHPYFIAEKNKRVVGAFACPPDPKEIAWIRVFAARGKFGCERAWEVLWPKIKESLIKNGTETVVAIPLQDWFKNILIHNNYQHAHNVIILSWDSEPVEALQSTDSFRLRPMLEKDINLVQGVDEDAFGPIWRNSLDTLQLAYKQALLATVAEDLEGNILGYQISTPSPIGAHLARLAVAKHAQGMGIGFQLTRLVQSMFKGRATTKVTVNTQDNNSASLGLYEKAGFKITGENYPVFQYKLK